MLGGGPGVRALVKHMTWEPARERVFATPSGRAEFSLAPLPDDVDPGQGRLVLTTIRSHDQFNATIYSNDDRYPGLKACAPSCS